MVVGLVQSCGGKFKRMFTDKRLKSLKRKKARLTEQRYWPGSGQENGPTSMRPAEDGRVLLYAMEIGSNGFLSGSVTLKGQQVVAVEKPTLK